MSEINQLIRNFVIKNDSLFQKESNYKIENIIKKKKAIISNKNQKEKSIKLLKELKQFLGRNGPNNQGELLMKINKDPILCKNSEIINILKQSPQIELNNHQTENTDLLFSTRNLIKKSYNEIKSLELICMNPINLLHDLNMTCKIDSSIMNQKIAIIQQPIYISPSFKKLIISISSHDSKEIKLILALLFTMYNEYYKAIEFNCINFTEILCMHNNIEMLLFVLGVKQLITENKELSFEYITLKNFSSELINQVLSNLISQLTVETSEFNTFENINLDINYRKCQKMITSSLETVFKFFELFIEYAIERDLLFNLNYVLNLYFDMLNRKILLVKDFNLSDIKNILNICHEIVPNIKKNIQSLAKDNMDLSVKLMNILETNLKYKKFEEILFVLNANLKEIRNFVINSNYSIQLDKNELIELIESIFELSENRMDLIEFIDKHLGLK